jgi:ubiquinone/menaquinone biosynthesis C-methylase UbiE
MFLQKDYTFTLKVDRMADSHKTFVCPWWFGYALLIPFRRLAQDPNKILTPFVREGMTVLEVGPGMGYFTLTLARLVGASGKILCVDVQEKMLNALQRRAKRAGVDNRISLVFAAENSLRIEAFEGKVDFAMAFAVAHEVPNQARLFEQIHESIKPGGTLLFSEPVGHVTSEEFRKSVDLARSKGFEEISTLHIKRSLTVLLRKRSREMESKDGARERR